MEKQEMQPVGRLLFQLALPAITAQIVNVLYNVVDRVFIGHIETVGAQALTGVGVTLPVIMTVSAFSALISMGGAPRAAIMMGRREVGRAEQIMGNCFSALILIAVILTAVMLGFGESILMFFGASSNTISYALDYLNVYSLGILFVQVSLGMNAFITTQGHARTSMMTVLIGAGINVLLDPIFIFLLGMGVRGAAVATVISQAASAVWVMRFLTSSRTTLKLKRSNMRIIPTVLLPCVALGVSPFVMQFTESILIICFNTSLLRYGGDLAVGAMTILMTVMQFAMLPVLGLAQGAQPIISYNYGAGNFPRVRKTFKLLLLWSVFYTTVLWTVCMFCPQLIITMFTEDSQLIRFSVWAMRIYMGTVCLFGIQTACQQSFVAMGNAKTSVFLAIFRKILVLIPLIYVLPLFLEDQVAAVFLAEPIADFCAVGTTSVLFYRAYRKLNRKYLVIPDSFKGTMTSAEVCGIMEEAIQEYDRSTEVISVPIGDGGEGTVDCFLHSFGGKKISLQVTGPFGGERTAYYGKMGDVAVVEMAAAAGYTLADPEKKDPSTATTYGVGQIIAAAVSDGCRQIILVLGGSCSNDGGTGMAAALGTKFYDEDGKRFVPVGKDLHRICRIDNSGTQKLLKGIAVDVMCDVKNSLFGANGAAYVFAPQKGADAEMTAMLDENLRAFSDVIRKELDIDVSTLEGGGAAGGMGAGACAFLGGVLKPGIDVILDRMDLDAMVKGCHRVFTGEGQLDPQSLGGKAVAGVAGRVKPYGIPVVVIAGRVTGDISRIYSMGVTDVLQTDPGTYSDMDEVAANCRQDLKKTMMKALKKVY